MAGGAAVADRGATVVQAGRDLGLSWPTVWNAFTAHAEQVLPAQPQPVEVLGIDETYRGMRRRWRQDTVTGRWEPIWVTDVRPRTTWTLRGRRSRVSDGKWQVRHLLTRNHEELSQRRFPTYGTP